MLAVNSFHSVSNGHPGKCQAQRTAVNSVYYSQNASLCILLIASLFSYRPTLVLPTYMPSSITAAKLKEQANVCFLKGKYSEADIYYSEALRLIAKSSSTEQHSKLTCVVHCNRSAARLSLGDYNGALIDANFSLTLDSRYDKAWFRKAVACQNLGQFAAALEAAEECMKHTERKSRSMVFQLVGSLKQLVADESFSDASLQAECRQDFLAADLPSPFSTTGCEYVRSCDGVNQNLVILFHGLGDSPATFAQLARHMQLPQTAALALAGPQPVPFTERGRSWFTVFDEEFELIQGRPGEQRRMRSLQSTLDVLQRLLRILWQRYGWPSHSVHLMGFSQGGTVALELAMQCAVDGIVLGSCVAVSSCLLEEHLQMHSSETAGLRHPQGNDKVAAGSGCEGIHRVPNRAHLESAAAVVGLSSNSKNASPPFTLPAGSVRQLTPVLLTHGSADQVVPRSSVEQTVQRLQRVEGIGDVQLQNIAGKQHSMAQSPEEMRLLMKFWSQVLGQKPVHQGDDCTVCQHDLIEIKPGHVSLEALP